MKIRKTVLERNLQREFRLRLRLAIARESIQVGKLTPMELARFREMKSGPRRDSWLKGRSALKRLLAGFGEGEETSHILFPNSRFSLTHSGDYAAAVGTDRARLRGVGIDLELNRLPRPEAARFFLNAEELRWWKRLDRSVGTAELLRLWTVKEALFKSYPGNREMGLLDFYVEEPEQRGGRAFVRGEPSAEILYCSFPLMQGALSVAIFS